MIFSAYCFVAVKVFCFVSKGLQAAEHRACVRSPGLGLGLEGIWGAEPYDDNFRGRPKSESRGLFGQGLDPGGGEANGEGNGDSL